MKNMLRWRVLLAGSVVAALAVAGVALAGSVGSAATVSATFAATTVTHKDVRTCTGADGTYEITHATYTGTATSSDARLNGTLEVDVKSVINTTKSLGWVQGRLDVNGSTAGNDAHGRFTAVYSGGQTVGQLFGGLHGASGDAKLLGSISGPFASASGFSSLSLGTGSATNVALAFGGSCDNGKHDHGNKPDKPGKPDKHHDDD